MKELICHLDTRGMANMFILHDGVPDIVSFLAVRSDTTTSMLGAWSKATRSLQTFQASTTATHLFLRPPKGQNETLLGATDDYCVSSSREKAWLDSSWGRQLLRNFQNMVQGSRKTSGRAMWRQVTRAHRLCSAELWSTWRLALLLPTLSPKCQLWQL